VLRCIASRSASSQAAAIEFEAVWASRDPSATQITVFAEHLRETVPVLVSGLAV